MPISTILADRIGHISLMASIRTVIVDDNAAMRKALRAVIDGYRSLEVISEAANGEEAIRQVQNLMPDLIIMDISMPILDGLSAAEVVKRHRPETDILIFSTHKIREFIESAKKIGLSGFVSKDEGGVGLLNAVNAILQHHPYFPTLS